MTIASSVAGLKSPSRGLLWPTVTRFVAVALFFDGLAPLFPDMAREVGFTSLMFQAVLGLGFVSFSIGQLISAPVVNRWGGFAPAGLSCLFVALASAFLPYVGEPHVFASILLLIFVVNSVGSAATRLALRGLTSLAGFQKVIGLATSASQIKGIVVPLASSTLTARYGWGSAIVVLAVPVLLAGVWMIAAAPRDGHAAPSPAPTKWTIVHSRSFWRAVAVAACFQIVFGPVSTRLPFLLADQFKLTGVLFGLAMSGAAAAIAIGYAAAAWCSGKISNNAMILFGVLLMLIGSCLSVASLCAGIGWAAVCGINTVQLAAGFILVPSSGNALDVDPEDRPAATALFGFVQPFVSGAAIFVAGLLKAKFAALAVVDPLLMCAAIWVLCNCGNAAVSTNR